jgi:Probable molybdopterin binding domain
VINVNPPTRPLPKRLSRAALLVIGSNILSGRTKDQNIGYVAECLTAVGIDLKEVRVVGDEERSIVDAMRSAPLGMRVMRRRASFISAPVVFTHSCRKRARADRCQSAHRTSSPRSRR